MKGLVGAVRGDDLEITNDREQLGAIGGGRKRTLSGIATMQTTTWNRIARG
jgi:hypothetical protein